MPPAASLYEADFDPTVLYGDQYKQLGGKPGRARPMDLRSPVSERWDSGLGGGLRPSPHGKSTGLPQYSEPKRPSASDRERMMNFILQTPFGTQTEHGKRQIEPLVAAARQEAQPLVAAARQEAQPLATAAQPASVTPEMWPLQPIATEVLHMPPKLLKFVAWLNNRWLKELLWQTGGGSTQVKLGQKCWFVTNPDSQVRRLVLRQLAERETFIKDHVVQIWLRSGGPLVASGTLQLDTLYPLLQLVPGVGHDEYAFMLYRAPQPRKGKRTVLEICGYAGAPALKMAELREAARARFLRPPVEKKSGES